MAAFTFELVSPERQLFSGPVESVVVPGTDGDMTIMANHAPVMTSLRPGIVAMNDGKGQFRRIFVRGGFADISAAGLTILAEQAIAVEDIKAEDVAQQMRNAEEDLRDAKTSEARAAAEEKLAGLKEMMAAVRN